MREPTVPDLDRGPCTGFNTLNWEEWEEKRREGQHFETLQLAGFNFPPF